METVATENTIALGSCECGVWGQLFQDGKCAHCTIRDQAIHIKGLEAQIEAISQSGLPHLESDNKNTGQVGGRTQ